MSENRAILLDTAAIVFAEAKIHGFAPVQEAGFETLLIAEAKGGFGGDFGDLYAVMSVAGAMALMHPVGEKIIAARLTCDAGGEEVIFDPVNHRHLGAFLRVAQSAGALDAALAMSIEHTNTRVQFGKAMSKQQAVQQSLAIFACEAAAVNVAGQAAARSLDHFSTRNFCAPDFATPGSGGALFEIAAAKLRTNKAIGIGTSIAHQVHGAIGFTQEYGLHPLTTGLMRWRSEYGHDAYWADILGGIASGHGGIGLWSEITQRGDRVQSMIT
jgi:acyl-CoA dehydrogenase